MATHRVPIQHTDAHSGRADRRSVRDFRTTGALALSGPALATAHPRREPGGMVCVSTCGRRSGSSRLVYAVTVKHIWGRR